MIIPNPPDQDMEDLEDHSPDESPRRLLLLQESSLSDPAKKR